MLTEIVDQELAFRFKLFPEKNEEMRHSKNAVRDKLFDALRSPNVFNVDLKESVSSERLYSLYGIFHQAKRRTVTVHGQ